jgi:cobalt-precorrin 5A hydrolase/precorrin-3B C17-methyltransferase
MRVEARLQDTGRRRLVLGLGCERGTPAAELVALAVSALSRVNADPFDIAVIATLDSRADEAAIRAVAAHFSVPLVTFPAARLEAETPRLATPSAVVFAHTGCHGVAEAAALAEAGPSGRLALAKTKSAHATVAIAESFEPLAAISSRIDSAPSHFDSSRDRA